MSSGLPVGQVEELVDLFELPPPIDEEVPPID
jgi:hypothetical protein